MIDKTIEVERMEHVISVFGSFDQNLRIIESELSVKVLDRDNQIHICGEAEQVLLAEKAINGLLTLAAKGENIDAQNVRYILKLVSEGKETKISQLAGDVVCITAKGKPIKPKTLGQKAYCDAIQKNTVTLGIGPAGTGKTYLAVAAAVAAFRAEEVNRIILTRPAVEAGERLGFLPGDLQSKVDPYLRPLYDALFDMLGADTYQKYLERGNIEVAPLAGLHARPHARRQLHHPRRGAEHLTRADEDVPDPHRLWLEGRHHRRHHADRPARGQDQRPQGRDEGPRGHRRYCHLHADRLRRRAAPPRAEDHRGLRRLREKESGERFYREEAAAEALQEGIDHGA